MKRKYLYTTIKFCFILTASLLFITGCSQSADNKTSSGTNVEITGTESAYDSSALPENLKETQTNENTSDISSDDSTSDVTSKDLNENEEPDSSSDASDNPPSNPEVSLIMVGDVLLHTPVAKSGLQEDGTYDFHHLFTNVKDQVQEADLALVNQEVILGGTELGISGYPAFNAPYELGDALVDTGFNVILHATNHALDKGKKGILNCMNFWNTRYPDITFLGIHEKAEDLDNIYVYEKDGIKIAILNYTYGTNGIKTPADMPFAVEYLEENKLISDLQKAEEMADFTVVCPHWGTEYVLDRTKNQLKWAKLMADNGADLIIGTHPHVTEPVALLTENEDGTWTETKSENMEQVGEPILSGEGTLVYYSLGNFVNWTSGTGEGVANRMLGAMAKVTISKNPEGIAYIESWQVEPLVSHVESDPGAVTVYPLDEYNKDLANRNQIIRQDKDFSYDYCTNLAEQVFANMWHTAQ